MSAGLKDCCPVLQWMVICLAGPTPDTAGSLTFLVCLSQMICLPPQSSCELSCQKFQQQHGPHICTESALPQQELLHLPEALNTSVWSQLPQLGKVCLCLRRLYPPVSSDGSESCHWPPSALLLGRLIITSNTGLLSQQWHCATRWHAVEQGGGCSNRTFQGYHS